MFQRAHQQLALNATEMGVLKLITLLLLEVQVVNKYS